MIEAATSTGRQGKRTLLSGKSEIKAAIIAATAGARRTIAILTPDLEPEIYDQDDFLDALKRLVLARGFARVRVLITHPSRTMKSGNNFVSMARRLNSHIEFRHLKPELGERNDASFIADERAIVYRARIDSWDGMSGPCEPAVARYYLDTFDELWQACATDLELRRSLL